MCVRGMKRQSNNNTKCTVIDATRLQIIQVVVMETLVMKNRAII